MTGVARLKTKCAVLAIVFVAGGTTVFDALLLALLGWLDGNQALATGIVGGAVGSFGLLGLNAAATKLKAAKAAAAVDGGS